MKVRIILQAFGSRVGSNVVRLEGKHTGDAKLQESHTWSITLDIYTSGGGLGGIIASVTFKSDESPHYTTGIWVTFGITMVY
jgi:hypothetical protein